MYLRVVLTRTSDYWRMIDGLLVIVPCGQSKIWDKDAGAGATVAESAYTGSPFIVNRQFAEHFGQKWVILSAKYGFVAPDFPIPGPYNVTFKRKATGPISNAVLQKQVKDQGLDQFDAVIGLGGKDYRKAIEAAFDGNTAKLHFPFAGLQIGKAMRAAKQAIAADNPQIGHPGNSGLIKTREAVLQAIGEYDDLGREQFLRKHGFRPAKGYFLVHKGKRYDSKAIVAAAFGFEHPKQGPLKASEFSGGAATVQKWLERLGFKVEKHAGTPSKPPSPTQKTNVAVSDLGNASVEDICQTLHQWLNDLPVHSFPFSEKDIPRNGIYILFEDGELAHGTRRIVRIGTHTGKNQLRSRLKQHFVNENKDRSIFRKNVGRCLLNRGNDPFLAFWDLDLTTSKAKKQYAGQIDFEKQKDVERRVSEYMQNHLRFAVFEVLEKDQRLEIESRITSTVSLCADCRPSDGWLGLHSPKKKIRDSGLWQVNELYKTAFSADELRVFAEYLLPGEPEGEG
jgi:hypothetical protein